MAMLKVALITAGSAGLGAQIARVLAPDFRVTVEASQNDASAHLEDGFESNPAVIEGSLDSSSEVGGSRSTRYIQKEVDVINYAHNEERASQLVKELAGIPGGNGGGMSERFHAIRADVGVKSEVQRLVAETVERMGRLDVVVSNAGWTRMTDFSSLDDGAVDEDWDRCFIYNVKTHLWLMHAAKPWLERTEGAFVSTASLAGVKPSGSSLPYAVTKAAQIHLAKSLAVICAPKIRVNSVSPGMLLTEWGLKFPASKREATIAKTQLQRLASVEDVALNVRTLVLSQSQTGQNVVLDCGSSL